jgi:hypothetical protein
MSAYLVDPEGQAVPEPPLLPVRTVAMAAIALLVIALAAILFFFWLERPVAPGPAQTIAEAPRSAEPAALAQPAQNEQLVAAPAPSCIDGKPASADIPAEACQ